MARISVTNLTFCYEGSFDNVFEDVSFSMVDNRIIVPAFLIKDQPRSHILLSTLVTVGIW